MPLLLRKITLSRWKLPGDPCSDVLKCLSTEAGKLSLWLVSDDKANLESVVTALASNADHVSELSYYMIDQTILERLGVRCEQIAGDTPAVNANQYHVDALGLTAIKLAELATSFYSAGVKGRRTNGEVKKILRTALAAKALDKSSMKASLLSSLEPTPVWFTEGG
jgi:hypothetical protein